jgi:uncharacterized protein (TIGR00725 family)
MEISPRRPVVGVMGSARAAQADLELAESLGAAVAAAGWILLTGGRDAGVMAAATRGAKRVAGSWVVGVLPGESGAAAPGTDVAIYTGLGNARNAVNVLSCDVVVACGRGGAGTASEIALAIKSGRPVVLLGAAEEARRLFTSLGGDVRVAASVAEAIESCRQLLSAGRRRE